MTHLTPQRHPVTTKRLLHRVEGAERTMARHDVRLSESGLAVDFYDPEATRAEPRPWVLFVNGLPDPGARRFLGCAIKDMASYESWGRAVAASGLVGVTHTTGNDPSEDVRQVWSILTRHGEDYGLAPGRGAIWACSSHVPNALGLLVETIPVPRAAVCCYGYMLDLDADTGVAAAQQQWRFANPVAGRTLRDLARVPTMVVRAGLDETPQVNACIDSFVRHALTANHPLTLVNHAAGAHAFELDDAGPASAEAVTQVLAFLVRHTGPQHLSGGA